MSALTSQELDSLPSSTPLYKGVGKMFKLSTREEIMKGMSESVAMEAKKEKEWEKKKEYLEKRFRNQQENYIELTQK